MLELDGDSARGEVTDVRMSADTGDTERGILLREEQPRILQRRAIDRLTLFLSPGANSHCTCRKKEVSKGTGYTPCTTME